MESPRAPEQAGHASDAATPGASVAAQHGDKNNSVFDTPGPPSPGQGSPGRHRSQEEGRSARGTRSRSSAGLEAAANALAAGRNNDSSSTAAAPAPAPPEPLSRPRLRVQGADIILEDASSPKASFAAPAGAARPQQAAVPAAARSQTQTQPSAAAAANHHAPQAQALEGLSPPPQQQQQQQQPPVAAVQLGGNSRGMQSHEHELQLRLASRTATGISNMAHAASSKPAGAALAALQSHVDERARVMDGDLPPGGSNTPVEGPVRMKYRSTLTEENVAYLGKLDQYSARPESSERIWRWLEGSGPPFDNPPPSLGVPTVSKAAAAAAAAGKRQPTGKRGFFSCFNCFTAQQ